MNNRETYKYEMAKNRGINVMQKYKNTKPRGNTELRKN